MVGVLDLTDFKAVFESIKLSAYQQLHFKASMARFEGSVAVLM